MSNLSIFNYNSQEVRTITIDEKPWFVAKDLCEVLNLSNPSQSLSNLDDDEKNTITLNDGNRGNPEMLVVSESGFYALALRCRKPEAKPFRKWVTSEVLPSIRKTGSYSISPEPEVKALPERDTVEYIEAAETLESLPNSTLKMLLRDSLVDELELQRNNKLLPGTKKRYTIVKVRAKELGYTAKEIGKGAGLGRFVAKQIDPSHKEGVGRYSVNHFEVTPELDMAIHQYFGRNALTLVQ